MNRTEIMKMLEEINLNRSEYWLVTGSALVMHNVKTETNDIDIGCTSELFEQLADKGYKIRILNDGTRCLSINDFVEVFENWTANEIVIIEGFPTSSLESIKAHKLKLGREKDLNDVKIIDEFLKNHIK